MNIIDEDKKSVSSAAADGENAISVLVDVKKLREEPQLLED